MNQPRLAEDQHPGEPSVVGGGPPCAGADRGYRAHCSRDTLHHLVDDAVRLGEQFEVIKDRGTLRVIVLRAGGSDLRGGFT